MTSVRGLLVVAILWFVTTGIVAQSKPAGQAAKPAAA
jgi:hypothetical protein